MITKNDPRFTATLDANDPDFARKFREAIGAKEGDAVEIHTPQFTRTDGRTVAYWPCTAEEFDGLKLLPHATLKELGLGVWKKMQSGAVHWLYPGEWFSCIPEGYEVDVISGERERWERAKADDDVRFGCLAYGFIQEPQP